jgi:TRAP-type transport system periplasmic protein
MHRKHFIRSLLAAAACVLCATGAQAQALKLTLGHGAAVGNPRHEASVKFAEAVKAKSSGRIEVQVAPSAQLGDDAAMVTALRTGALDMSANSQGAVANAVPEYAAYGMPFAFSSTAAAFKLLDGALGKELADKSAEKGLILLGTWDNGIRQMTNSKRPIVKVDDIKGLAPSRSRSSSPSSTWRCSKALLTAKRTPWSTSTRARSMRCRSTWR